MKIKIVGEIRPETHRMTGKLLLEDGRDLCSMLPVTDIHFRWQAGRLPEIEIKISPTIVEFDLLATVETEDLVRQLREIDSIKYKRENKS